MLPAPRQVATGVCRADVRAPESQDTAPRLKGERAAYSPSSRSLRTTSLLSGKRPLCSLEKIGRLSATISNEPVRPPFSTGFTPRALSISAARLAARGL